MDDKVEEKIARSQLSLQGIQYNQCHTLSQKWNMQNEIKQSIRIQDDFQRLRNLEIIDQRKSSSIPNLNIKKNTLLNRRSLQQTQNCIQDDSTQCSKYYENDKSFQYVFQVQVESLSETERREYSEAQEKNQKHESCTINLLILLIFPLVIRAIRENYKINIYKNRRKEPLLFKRCKI